MEKRLFELIIQIRKKCLQTEEKIRSELRMTPGEFNGLLSIEPGEKVLGAAFSQRMGLSASRGSRVIGRMLKSGFIDLEQVPDDRRAVEASLTREGIAMQKRLMARMGECEERILSQLDDAMARNIREALTALVDVM